MRPAQTLNMIIVTNADRIDLAKTRDPKSGQLQKMFIFPVFAKFYTSLCDLTVIKDSLREQHARLTSPSSPPNLLRHRVTSIYKQGSITMQDTTEKAYPVKLDSSSLMTPEPANCRRKKVTAYVHVRHASRGVRWMD